MRSAFGLSVHTPCGPRKSGIPESVEIPAPVRATMRFAESISSRALSKGCIERFHHKENEGHEVERKSFDTEDTKDTKVFIVLFYFVSFVIRLFRLRSASKPPDRIRVRGPACSAPSAGR